MKFGKRLKHQAQQSLPEWRDKFLSYKDLKRLVKVISVASASAATADGAAAEKRFVHLLNREIDKFNAFFMEQEEEFVIRHRELQQRIQVAMNKWRQKECGFREEMAEVRKEIVNFHGEMVLLINYSIINYTGVAKILKKYDKRTGGVLRRPFIKNVVSQPFFTIDIISKLVKECETAMKLVFPPCAAEETLHFRRKAMGLDVPRDGVFRNTVAALLTMQEIRRGSSTYSNFSLPPLDLLDFDVIQSLQVASPIQIP